MSIDNITKVAILEVMGINVFKQLTTVVPDFFDENFVLAKMVEKPKEQQHKHYPHVKVYGTKVMVSTHPEHEIGNDISLNGDLTNLLDQGYNISVSPFRIRSDRIHVDADILEEAPHDSLVIGEALSNEPAFANSIVFYAHNAYLRNTYGELREEEFCAGIARNHVHFAFIPHKTSHKRNPCYIDKKWKLKVS